MDLFGTTVLITGASSGIGAAIARAYAAEGARVVMSARCSERLNELVNSIGETRSMAVTADISDPQQVENLIAKAQERFGDINILVNNAAVGLISEIQNISPDDFLSALRINVLGPLYTIQKTIPIMRRNGGGIIINISSMVTRIATWGNGGYRATKMALDSLSDASRVELKKDRIRVITVYPGLTRTDFFYHSLGKSSKTSLNSKRFRYTPEQVARKVIQASYKEPRAAYMGLRSKLGGLVAQLFPGILENLMLLKKGYL
ncbi:MAG TPA: SDR family oxidoreductase [Chitinispirillaceae bacterium]|nr:SDR family oxidoreductase [Chitinispirillaceae bacterium]